MRKEKTKEDAVSPVIGVMLLLVVTVVIAAVVVGFSTGLAGSTKTTPTALFEVEYIQMSDLQGKESQLENANGLPGGMLNFNDFDPSYLANFGIKHKGGDPIALKDIQVVLEQKGGSSGNDGVIISIQAVNDKIACNPTYEEMKDDLWSFGMAFPLMVLGKGDPDSWDVISGVTVETGDVLRVVHEDGSDSLKKIGTGTTVKWTISYIPTNSVIAKGEFEVIAD